MLEATSSDSAPSSGGDHSSLLPFWWFHALDAFMFLLLAVASALRGSDRLSRWLTAPEQQALLKHASPAVNDRARDTARIFGTLVVYGVARCTTEALVAFNVIPFASFRWTTICSVPSSLFGLLQTFMIYKWVRCVDEMVFEIRHAHFRLGAVLGASSGAVLGCLVGSTIFAAFDVHFHLTRLTKSGWSEFLSFVQGILYTFNGVCFLSLGIQLAYYWSTTAPSNKTAQRRIMAIAAVFTFVCVARGVVLCVFSWSLEDSAAKQMHDVMESNWGAPLVLFIEWLCLAVSLFVLQPSVDSGIVVDHAVPSLPSDDLQSPDPARERESLPFASSFARRVDGEYSAALRSQYTIPHAVGHPRDSDVGARSSGVLRGGAA